MTTAAGTPSDRSVLPITERYALLGWLRRNLFSDIFNSILTLAALAFIFVIARIFLHWVFFSAEWGVIPANFNLLMRGQYPAAEAWRLWLVIYLLGAVVGVTWNSHQRPVQRCRARPHRHSICAYVGPLLLHGDPSIPVHNRRRLRSRLLCRRLPAHSAPRAAQRSTW